MLPAGHGSQESAMPMSPDQTRARAQVAARARHHGDTADVAEAREELHQANEIARVDAHIDAVVASAPKMTEEQAARLRALFAPLVHKVPHA
jgi:hypothetical protein